eukprot:CAMPEP_0171318096 /NCGR_PEP_ID=MMETSP0816-20121228/85660_1 /TAXON_ID=420281 /ORGANISM="Proboscia inermis, Strain CCAP1064/1" /LENGTH=58 /DNA_ID=CAMNT_0011812155 /DNA_START=1 /DNA_END=174 /DNA_ORIENTATION=-
MPDTVGRVRDGTNYPMTTTTNMNGCCRTPDVNLIKHIDELVYDSTHHPLPECPTEEDK